MGVYIRNIDIPEIKRGVAAIINIDDILFLKTADDIVLIPDHGDLIDRDAWRKSLIDEGETIGIDGFSIDGLSADDVCYAIENAPVVIPAERSKDGEA